MKLGILTSHPIQYQAPLFRALAREVELNVYFAHRATPRDQANAGFGVEFNWDGNLTSGYPFSFLKNESRCPGIEGFFGCDTPSIRERIQESAFNMFIVMGWNFKSYWQAIMACKRMGVPVFVRGDSNLATRRPWSLQQIKKIFYPIFASYLDGFLSVGRRSKEYLLYYGVPEQNIYHTPHFVDNDWFQQKSVVNVAERELFRISIGVSSKTILVLFVGKLLPEKRPMDLVEAIFNLRKMGVDITAVFVGAGPMETAVRERAEDLGTKIHMAGFKNQTQLPYYYGIVDILVLPSLSETWGLVVNEAMACGLPAVVSSAVGCSDDLIEPGKTGMVFEVGDVARLAQCIRIILPLLGGLEMKEAIRNKIARYSVGEAVAGIRLAYLKYQAPLEVK